jgi:hypothetical protein
LSHAVGQIQDTWPRLKAQTNDMDFSGHGAHIIPRALQCDEDLSRMVEEFRSLVALRYGMRA